MDHETRQASGRLSSGGATDLEHGVQAPHEILFVRRGASTDHVAWLDRPLAGGRQRDADRGAKPDVALGLGLSIAGTRTRGSLVRCLPHAWPSPPAARRWSAAPTTRRSAWTAAMSEVSSLPSLRMCSARVSPTGCASATDVPS